MKFTTTIAGTTVTGIEVPAEVIEALGRGKKPPVVITLNGYTYRNTVAVMGGRYMVALNVKHREAARVAGGDEPAQLVRPRHRRSEEARDPSEPNHQSSRPAGLRPRPTLSPVGW
ncbi:hypothetical protein GCM10009554_79190 [Kribbella koreensis]|uniref:DUF1905 domain-containing protein n=1 Tax=Kribbella koreensis TaxID=57909 RepID=A0ABP4C8U6_9ACTN